MRHRSPSRVVAAILAAIAVASCDTNSEDLTVTDSSEETDDTSDDTSDDASDATSDDGADTDAGAPDTTSAPEQTPAPTPAPTTATATTEPPPSAPISSDALVTPTTEKRPVGTATPTEPAGATDTVYERGAIDRGLGPFTDRAVADLADRLGVAADSIEVLTAVLVVWPDAGLGCPEPDMVYAQVLTDGSVIELGVDDRVYRYHTGGSQGPFLCDRPLTTPPNPVYVP